MGETLMWSFILMNWVLIDGSWWQHEFLIKTP